jgi:hypothetical protein
VFKGFSAQTRENYQLRILFRQNHPFQQILTAIPKVTPRIFSNFPRCAAGVSMMFSTASIGICSWLLF